MVEVETAMSLLEREEGVATATATTVAAVKAVVVLALEVVSCNHLDPCIPRRDVRGNTRDRPP